MDDILLKWLENLLSFFQESPFTTLVIIIILVAIIYGTYKGYKGVKYYALC